MTTIDTKEWIASLIFDQLEIKGDGQPEEESCHKLAEIIMSKLVMNWSRWRK